MATAAMAKPEVRIGGFLNFQVGVISQDRQGYGPSPGGVVGTNPDRGYDSVSDSEVIVRVSDKLDSGMAWALKIELEANTDDGSSVPSDSSTADEVTVTLSGTWGQLMFGADDGPADTMRSGSKRATGDAGSGGTGGDFRRWLNWSTPTNRFWSNASDMRDTSDAAKIAYITPRFFGFQAGVSFSPDRDSEGRYRDPDNNGTEQNFWEFGINYDQKFDQVRVNVSATAGYADNENEARENTKAWYLGTNIGFAGFQVGGGYGSEDKRNLSKAASNGKTVGWDIGVGYEMGDWNFALGYFRSTAGVINGSGEHKLSVVTLGATYELGAGLSVYTEGVYMKADSATNNATSFDNEGIALISGIEVEF
jgi:predicted porin